MKNTINRDWCRIDDKNQRSKHFQLRVSLPVLVAINFNQCHRREVKNPRQTKNPIQFSGKTTSWKNN